MPLEARDKWKLQKLFQSTPDREAGRCSTAALRR